MIYFIPRINISTKQSTRKHMNSPELPKTFLQLYTLLDSKYSFEKILIVNSVSTGSFLDRMCANKKPLRIKYNRNNLEEFITQIKNITTQFDLILVDPYHEYEHSIVTYRMLTELLDDKKGILISHDCFPDDVKLTSPVYQPGKWCGVTYAAFIENAYENHDFYYAVINHDYGLGIMSKQEILFVKPIVEKEKQRIFLDLFQQDKYEEAYHYLTTFSKEIINLLSE
jgi:hypothetical protein